MKLSVVIRYKRLDIVLLETFQFLLQCLCKQWNRHKSEKETLFRKFMVYIIDYSYN